MKSELSKLIDWGTYEHCDCHTPIWLFFISLLSINIFPVLGLSKQRIWLAIVLLPLPVLPTKAIFEPIGIFKFIFLRANSSREEYL